MLMFQPTCYFDSYFRVMAIVTTHHDSAIDLNTEQSENCGVNPAMFLVRTLLWGNDRISPILRSFSVLGRRGLRRLLGNTFYPDSISR